MAEIPNMRRWPRFEKRLFASLGMLLIAALFLYRGRGNRPGEGELLTPTEQTSIPTEAVSSVSDTAETEATGEMTVAAEENPGTDPESEATPEERETEGEYRPIVYDARSYELVTDMVYAFKHQVKDRQRIIAEDVEALKKYDPALGEAWGGIMEYWDYADNRMELNFDSLPEDLPRDDSLCIVVLGFQLLPDGGMPPEMLGRCELALFAAEQYPNAYLALTGGGTAHLNPTVTEAGVMAQWFLDHGVSDRRLILEDCSSTTEENAKFTLKILADSYPQIQSIAIVSSDYHIPLGCTLFTEAALLYGCEHGGTPWSVDAHLALRGYGLNEYTNPAEQALYIWALADPQLKND